MRERHVPSLHFPLPYARNTYIPSHTQTEGPMDKLDDLFFYATMATLFASTLAVGILAALHETALLAGGV